MPENPLAKPRVPEFFFRSEAAILWEKIFLIFRQILFENFRKSIHLGHIYGKVYYHVRSRVHGKN